MKMLSPLLFAVALIFIIGSACSTSGGGTEPAQPQEQEPTQISTATDVPVQPTVAAPTEAPSPTAIPDTPTPAAQQFFTDEFDTDQGNWLEYIIDGKTSTISEEQYTNVFVKIADSSYLFDIQRLNTWIYSTYEPYEYEDVRIETLAVNQGANTNNVSLICRYTKENGWYEFNIANNGLYWIYYAKPNDKGYVSYNLIANGGSTKIKTGKDVNQYAAICRGKTLTLFINDNLTKEVTDNKYTLSKGKVGVSISSFQLPVKVKFDWVKISEP